MTNQPCSSAFQLGNHVSLAAHGCTDMRTQQPAHLAKALPHMLCTVWAPPWALSTRTGVSAVHGGKRGPHCAAIWRQRRHHGPADHGKRVLRPGSLHDPHLRPEGQPEGPICVRQPRGGRWVHTQLVEGCGLCPVWGLPICLQLPIGRTASRVPLITSSCPRCSNHRNTHAQTHVCTCAPMCPQVLCCWTRTCRSSTSPHPPWWDPAPLHACSERCGQVKHGARGECRECWCLLSGCQPAWRPICMAEFPSLTASACRAC
jgi:hypothetical protein